MDHEQHRSMQQAVLDQTLAILRADARVLGVVVTGSYARGEQDAFSDLDVACYLRDEAATGKVELFEQVGQIGPTLWQALIYDYHGLYLFEDGVRLDLDFLKPSDLEHAGYVYTGVMVVYDPDGAVAPRLPAAGTLEDAPHPKGFEPGDPLMIDWFFWMFRQVVCWAKRGAQGDRGALRDRRAFEKLSNAVNSLAEVRARLVEMRLWTLGKRDYLSRADPGLAELLAQTYPHLEAGEIIECARRLLAAYEQVTPQYCQKTQAVYPAHKVARIKTLIEEFAAM